MNNIQIFKNNEFGEVRTLVVEGEPWFVGKDVAESLGYAKARNAIATHVDGEDKKDAPIQGTLGGVQEMKAMYNLLTIVSVALIIWISSSWAGVMTHTAGKDYSNYNFFVMLGGE